MDLNEQNLQFLSGITNNVLDWALTNFPNKVFSTTAFGANGTVLMDFIKRKNKDIPIYFIDTGYHFPDTIKIKDYYIKEGFNIKVAGSTVDDANHVLREMGPDLCCSINKVEPMKKILQEHKGYLWITAVSRDQSETRKDFRYLLSQNNGIIKVCPMINWKNDEIWQYINKNQLTYNKLYNMGYKSIGCQPCTTPVKEGENDRAGRWRGLDKDECGLQIL